MTGYRLIDGEHWVEIGEFESSFAQDVGPFVSQYEALKYLDRLREGKALRLYRDADGLLYNSTEAWQ